jgi:hypothetical protein
MVLRGFRKIYLDESYFLEDSTRGTNAINKCIVECNEEAKSNEKINLLV